MSASINKVATNLYDFTNVANPSACASCRSEASRFTHFGTTLMRSLQVLNLECIRMYMIVERLLQGFVNPVNVIFEVLKR